jgi:LCP family protein required for cell wall assembly
VSDTRPQDSDSSGVSGIARHGRLKKASPLAGILSLIGIIVAVVLVASLTVTGYAVYNTIHKLGKGVAIGTGSPAPPPGIGVYPGGFNILIVGDDTRTGQHGIGSGFDDGGALNDVTILLHVSANHQFATAVSFPRDMILPHAQCSIGGTSAGLPINTALSYGGLPCVVTQIQSFTGVPIQFAGLITFTGVIEMAQAVGGVTVCTTGTLHDPLTGINLIGAGNHLLNGVQALEFLRTRHGVGDGSDLGRISSQQVYLSSLVRTMEASGTLSNPVTVYKIASAASSNMQLSTSLQSIPTMISIASTLKNISPSHVVFVQYPGTTGGTGIFAGKVQPTLSLGNQLIGLIKADKPFTLGTQGNNRGSIVKSNPTSTAAPLPGSTVINGLIGQSASEETCSKARPIQDQ